MSTQLPQETETESETESEPAAESARDRRLREKAERREADRVERAERPELEGEDTRLIKVFRYDPEVPEKQEPRFDEFHVPF